MKQFKHNSGWLVRLAICSLVGLLACSADAKEVLPQEIRFSADSQANPLIEVLPSNQGKGDHVFFMTEGLKLEQASSTKNDSPAGIVFKQSNQEAFHFSIQFDVLQLSAPKIPGFGHGLFVRVIPEQESDNVITIGYGVSQRNEKGFFWYAGLTPKPNEIQKVASTVSSGELLLLRDTETIRLLFGQAIGADGNAISYREMASISGLKGPVKEFQVLCLKQDSSKPNLEFLVKRLYFLGDDFYSQPPKRPPFFTAGGVFKFSLWFFALTAGPWSLYRLAKRKEWI